MGNSLTGYPNSGKNATQLGDMIDRVQLYSRSEGLEIGTSVWRSSRSAFGRSTGNDVSGHYKRHYFLFSFLFSSLSSTFLMEGVLRSKNLFSESCLENPKT